MKLTVGVGAVVREKTGAEAQHTHVPTRVTCLQEQRGAHFARVKWAEAGARFCQSACDESSKTLNHTERHAARGSAASPGGDAGSAGGAAGAYAANPPTFLA